MDEGRDSFSIQTLISPPSRKVAGDPVGYCRYMSRSRRPDKISQGIWLAPPLEID
jgi:hypothetical protein